MGITDDYLAGMSIVDIIVKYKVGGNKIYRLLRAQGIPNRGRATKYKKEDFVKLYESGKRIRDIAAIYGINESTVRYVLRELYIPKPRQSLTTDQQLGIVRDYENGVKLAAIRCKYNIHDSTMYRVLEKYGIPKRGHVKRADVINDYLDGMPMEEICIIYGISEAQVNNIVREYV